VPNARVLQYSTFAVAVAAVVFTLFYPTAHLPVRSFTLQDCVPFFTELTAIALFVERALEVLLTPWREKDAQEKELQHTMAKRRLELELRAAPGTPAAPAAATVPNPSDVVTTKQALVEYRSQTQQIAFLISLATGIVISLLGVRALQFFFDDASLAALPPRQHHLFQALDVVLTGALISGGADALHQVVTVFTDFANATSDKIKGN